MSEKIAAPTVSELEAIVRLKLGPGGPVGWAPTLRRRFTYYTPDEWYEALLARLVRSDTVWCDVGCGRHLLPHNLPLARQLAARCAWLVGVDSDPTVEENPFVHEVARCLIEDYESERRFDLLTLRMVAEHIEDPVRAVETLGRLAAPGCLAVVFTVNRYSPVPLLTRMVPFALHHPLKKPLWKTEREDSFPTRYRMNTQESLHSLFTPAGFDEVGFLHLDDCTTFGRFRALLLLELYTRKLLKALALRYPEQCLVGVYRRTTKPT